jgi:serine/threonine-protein kinase
VIHRDLKPSNILVDGNGRVKLLDFGIARLIGDEAAPGLTHEGAAALTPQYAAPEQFAGGALSMSTDVYALGVLLHELLTGTHPSGLTGASPIEYLRAAQDNPAALASHRARQGLPGVPPPIERAAALGTAPPALARALSADIDNVLARCLASRAEDRYRNVPELVDELQRFLRFEPVHARQATAAYRLHKLLQRRPVESALVAALLLASVAGAVATGWQFHLTEGQRQLAVRQRERAERMLTRSIAANEFTRSLLTELAQVARPVRFADVMERGERLALGGEAGASLDRVQPLLAMARFHLTQDHHTKAGELAGRAAALAERGGDPGLAELARCDQAYALAGGGQLAEGGALARRALAAAADDPQVQVACNWTLGFIGEMSGSGAETLSHARKALQAHDALGDPSARKKAELLDLVASGEALLNQNAEAEAHIREALALLRSAGLAESLEATTLLNNWSNVSSAKGQPRLAHEQLSESLRIQRSVLGDEAASVATMVNYANSCLRMQRLPQAREWASRGLERASREGSTLGEMHAHLILAEVARHEGRFDDAHRSIAAAARAVGKAEPGSERAVSIEIYRARLETAEGHAAQALRTLDGALEGMAARARKVGTDETVGSVRFALLSARATALGSAGRAAEGLAVAREVVAQSRRDQGAAAASADTGSALLVLAEVQLQAGEREGAARSAAEAAKMLSDALGAEHPKAVRAARIAGA